MGSVIIATIQRMGGGTGETQGQEGPRALETPTGAPTLAQSPGPKVAPTKTCRSRPLLLARGACTRQTLQPGSFGTWSWAAHHLPWALGPPAPMPPPHPPPRFPALWAPALLCCLIHL